MGKGKADRSVTGLYILFVVVLICLCMSGLQGIYGFSLFPDEFGYWSPAAGLLGYDWSEITALGYYYSYGYSILLVPILFLFPDSIMAYRAAVCTNLCFQIAGFLVLCGTAEKLLCDLDQRYRIVLCGIAALYPSWVFYTQMTMTESLLFFLYALSAWLLIRYTERPGAGRALPLAICLGYTYTVHMRTVGLLIASAAVLAWHTAENRGNKRAAAGMAAFFGTVLLLLAMSALLKRALQSGLYMAAEPSRIQGTDYAGQTGKLRMLFSVRGMREFLLGLSGKLLYLGCASFGTAYVGLYALCRDVERKLRGIRNRGAEANTLENARMPTPGMAEGAFGKGYVLLASVLQILIMNLYLLGSAGTENQRLDLFLHGRYDDFIIPVLMIAGFAELAAGKRIVRKMLLSGLSMLLLSVIAAAVIASNASGMDDPHEMLMLGMSYLLAGDGAQGAAFPIRAAGMAAAAGMLIGGVIIYRRPRGVWIALAAFAIGEIVLSELACSRMLQTGQNRIYGDLQMADRLQTLTEGQDRRIVCLYEDGNVYADILQFRLRGEKIHAVQVIDGENALSVLEADDLVLVDFESALNGALGEMYDENRELGHFDLYYNVR